MSKHKIDISIVIPTFNRSEDLYRCLLSLKNTQDYNIEIIVIDDNSTDFTVPMIHEKFPEVRLFINQINLGPSYARNIGINEAKGDYILFLDSDTRIEHTDILNNLIMFFKNHPETGTVGGELKINNSSADRVFGREISMDGNSRDRDIINEKGNFLECAFLATCCCMVRRELAQEIGGFDPYYGFGGEDKDFGYRINAEGYNNYVSADCAVAHYHSSEGRNPDETYRYHKTRMRFVLKCFPIDRTLIALIYWLSSIAVFYIILPFKLFFFMIRGKPVVRENLFGGLLIVRAFIENIRSFGEIKSARSINYLDPDKMEQFVSSHK